ncbi:MAG: Plug domain-containing protein, partial [Sphingomonadales bacterium]|nr:Plug domain-containing protein [Sphingomonadales bacterium]
MTRKSIVRGSATALLIAGGTADLGWAQDDQDSEDVEPMERITVTARKTEETAFEVPISLTAITEQTIQDSGLDNISDVALQTPGFSFRQGFGRTGGGQGGASVRPSIRGQSNILGGPNAAFFVDGIFVSGNITSYQLDNVQQIEVLRGPQSAL